MATKADRAELQRLERLVKSGGGRAKSAGRTMTATIHDRVGLAVSQHVPWGFVADERDAAAGQHRSSGPTPHRALSAAALLPPGTPISAEARAEAAAAVAAASAPTLRQARLRNFEPDERIATGTDGRFYKAQVAKRPDASP